MCMCQQANINGQPGYSWDGKSVSTRPLDPPLLLELDVLIHDEPGRCGGLDSHSHHFRLVKNRFGDHSILVRHGAGDERIDIPRYLPGLTRTLAALQNTDSHGRYWMLHLLYSICKTAGRDAETTERMKWVSAARDKRIKIRRRKGRTEVELLPRVEGAAT